MQAVNPPAFQRLRWQPFLPAGIVLGIGLALSAGLFLWLRAEARRTDQLRFNGLAEGARQMVDLVTGNYERALHELADALGTKTEIAESDWQYAVNRLQPNVNYPGMVELGLLKVQLARPVPKKLEMASADDFAAEDPAVKARLEEAVAFVKTTPLSLEMSWFDGPRDESLRGDNVAREKGPVTHAIEGQAPRMTGRRLVSKTGAGREVFGTTLVLPVANPNLMGHWSSNLWNNLKTQDHGMYYTLRNFVGKRYTAHALYASFDWQPFIESALAGQLPELDLQLYAGTNTEERFWLGGTKTVATRSATQTTRFATNYILPMYSSKWTLALAATPLFTAQSSNFRSWLALFGGGLIAALTALALAVQIRARLRQEAVAGALRHALDALESAREERKRLGRDVHDGVIQSLYAMQLGLRPMIEQVENKNPALARKLADQRRILTAVIGELRHFILRHETNPSAKTDLCRVLATLVARLQANSAVDFQLQMETGAGMGLTDAQEVQLANIAQEALSNSLRHGHPQRVEIKLARAGETLILSVDDDGCGFDPATMAAAGMGLRNMAVRAEESGGQFTVNSKPGQGTQVIVRIPINRLSEPNAT